MGSTGALAEGRLLRLRGRGDAAYEYAEGAYLHPKVRKRSLECDIQRNVAQLRAPWSALETFSVPLQLEQQS